MNAYQQILTNKYSEETAKDLMKWARKFTKLYYAPMIDLSKAAQKWIKEETRYELSESQAIAIVAVAKGKNKSRVTANLEDICTTTTSDMIFKALMKLQQTGMIEIYRVASPYQLVFVY